MRVRKILLFAAMGAFCVLFAALVGFTGSMLFVSAEEADEEQPHVYVDRHHAKYLCALSACVQ